MRLFNSVCASGWRSSGFSTVMMRVVSSAYVYTFEFGTFLIMLLMYSRKSVVESELPCGMPCVTVCVVDVACCVWVDCCLFSKYDWKNAAVEGVKLKSCSSLWMSFWCEIVS